MKSINDFVNIDLVTKNRVHHNIVYAAVARGVSRQWSYYTRGSVHYVGSAGGRRDGDGQRYDDDGPLSRWFVAR